LTLSADYAKVRRSSGSATKSGTDRGIEQAKECHGMNAIAQYCRHLGWRIAVAGLLVGGATSARANDWGNWPVPWPPVNSGNAPPPVIDPGPPIETPPPGGGNGPPPIDTPPPAGDGAPPAAEPPPEVPVPEPPGGAKSTPEPASAVMGLFGVGAGLLAWRRKRLG
jgi:hypothetical protein